jgi:hypothetical protein
MDAFTGQARHSLSRTATYYLGSRLLLARARGVLDGEKTAYPDRALVIQVNRDEASGSAQPSGTAGSGLGGADIVGMQIAGRRLHTEAGVQFFRANGLASGARRTVMQMVCPISDRPAPSAVHSMRQPDDLRLGSTTA